MTFRAHHLVATLFVGAVVLSSLALLTVNPSVAQAACASGSSVLVTNPSSTTTTNPMSGIVTLAAQAAPNTASGLTFMLLNPTQQAIGEAVVTGTSWTLSWDSRNVPNGTYQLMAIAHFGTVTSLDCASAAVPLSVNNLATQSPKLAATLTPNTWQGPAGATVPFTLDAVYADQYGRVSHVTPATINWHSTLGAVSPNSVPSTVFNVGTVLGSGPLLADVTYNSLAATAIATLQVTAAPVPSGTTTTTLKPSPTPAAPTTAPAQATPPSSLSPSPTPLTTADATRLAAMPTIFRPTSPSNSDPIVTLPTLGCLEKDFGTVRFAGISTGKTQPTAAERASAANCFSGPDPIPAVLAPIAPTHLTELPTTTGIVSLGSIKNQTTTAKDGSKVNGLLLSGTGAPNTNIFIYFFSDPLVLRAQTNSQGIWSYVLETPLKAGHHEVYAVAEKDAGNFVRTSAVPISVAAAAGNNTDGALVVDKGLSAAQIGFIAGAAAMVLAAIGLLFVLLRRRRPSPVALPTPAPAGPVASPSAPPVATLPEAPVLAQPAPVAAQPVTAPIMQPPVVEAPVAVAAPAPVPASTPVINTVSPQPTEPPPHDVQT